MKKEVKNWLESAQYDLETAGYMFNTSRYIYTIFMCHLALEKMLKAKAEEITGKTPPKVHNLRYLVKLSGLEPPEEIFVFLSKLSDVSIPTRYPEDFAELRKSYDKKAAKIYLDNTKEAFKWIKKSLKP
ncbi:MAG: HEPN domain-containing protein [Candidatus Edwardsbacteria bacterium]